MKEEWLNFVLSLTNDIYRRKQRLVEQTGFSVILNVITLIIYELFLGLISLPLYLTLKPEKTTAYFAEKSGYEKISFDYNLRRILTVTGVGIIAAIWLVKLLLIVFFPLVHGPLQLYSVSNLEPVDIIDQKLINVETGIQTARIVDTMQKPTLTKVQKISGQNYEFSGYGQPNSTIVLFLSDVSAAVYTGEVNKNGEWVIEHSQKNFKLNDGNHSVVVFGYDENQGVRSSAAPEQFFKTSTSGLDYLISHIDTLINWVVIIVICAGLFLIFLTI